MNIGAILVGMSMLIITVPFVVIPLRQGRRKEPVSSTKHLNSKDKRLELISSLSDLDFDYKIGTVGEEDYAILRTRLIAEAAQFLQEDDKVDDIEALIKARKALFAKTPGCEKCGQSIELGIHFCPRCGSEVRSTCPSCGKYIKTTDLFCSSCGNKLAIEVGLTS